MRLALVIAVIAALATTGQGQSFDAPKTIDGVPDLQGFWRGPGSGTENIEEHPKTEEDGGGKTLIVDPADGKIPYQTWALPLPRKHRTTYVEWMGDSRGHWEGNTLVVDVTNHNGKVWFDQAANFYTDAVHIVERFTLTDQDTMHYQVTIDDPNVYTRPWTMAFPLRAIQSAAFVFRKRPATRENAIQIRSFALATRSTRV